MSRPGWENSGIFGREGKQPRNGAVPLLGYLKSLDIIDNSYQVLGSQIVTPQHLETLTYILNDVKVRYKLQRE